MTSRGSGMVRLITVSLIVMSFVLASPAEAISLREAVKTALEANPEIGQAIANREATQFELRQALGLYLPQVDLEARYGAQNFDSPVTRLSGTSDDVLARKEANLTVSQLIFNGFGRRGEVEQQAAQVDSASHRVYERSELIALSIVRAYLDYGRLRRVIQLSEENLRYHRKILADVQKGATREDVERGGQPTRSAACLLSRGGPFTISGGPKSRCDQLLQTHWYPARWL